MQNTLQRALGLRDALAIVVGSVIGTGIFLKTAVMTQTLGSINWVLLAWLAAGVLSLLGAVTYAELGALFPQAGGGYLYIREGYGRLPAFLAGWISFWILFPGSIAAYGVAAATFMRGTFDLPAPLVSVFLIAAFSILNCAAVSFGGLVQSVLTAIKVLLILGLSAALFFFTPTPQTLAAQFTPGIAVTWTSFGAATLAALWAFDGWEAVSRIGGEIRNPQRNLPLALLIGIFAVFGLYALANVAYFYALPIQDILTSNSSAYPDALPVASKAFAAIMGDTGVRVISVVFVISTLGAMNGCIMTSARVPFAMAQDGLFFRFLSHVSPRTRVPVRAIAVQAVVACVLALSGTFDQLTDYVVFSAWIFYGLTGATVFIFRRRFPDRPRAFRVPGYPVVPILFAVMAVLLVVSTFIQSPRESLTGIGLILIGVPVYFAAFKRGKN